MTDRATASDEHHGYPAGIDDLRLSDTFVDAVRWAYVGMWTFERTLIRLDPSLDRHDELSRAEQVLEWSQTQRVGLESGIPLIRQDDRPLLDPEASRCWRLLHVAESRLRSLIQELIDSSDADTLRDDPFARHVRLAALAEHHRSQETRARDEIRLAESGNDEGRAESWRLRLVNSRVRLEEARDLAERFIEAGEQPDDALVEELLDNSLLLPARVAERVVELCRVFSLYTGVFEYTDVGIPEAQREHWQVGGFDPHAAGRWFAAGLTPTGAQEWIEAGATDPMVAAGFLWRGFTAREAAPWLRGFIGGRRASAWLMSGCDPAAAREWIALGVHDPDRLRAMPSSDRVM